MGLNGMEMGQNEAKEHGNGAEIEVVQLEAQRGAGLRGLLRPLGELRRGGARALAHGGRGPGEDRQLLGPGAALKRRDFHGFSSFFLHFLHVFTRFPPFPIVFEGLWPLSSVFFALREDFSLCLLVRFGVLDSLPLLCTGVISCLEMSFSRIQLPEVGTIILEHL